MGTHIADPWAVGGGSADLWEFLLVSGTGNTPFWVKNMDSDPHMKKTLGGFHHQVAIQVTGQLPQRQSNRSWNYQPLADAMRVKVLEELETYISIRQNTVDQYIEAWPILDLFLEAEKSRGHWWQNHCGITRG